MAANPGDVAIVGNTVTDALALNNQSESATHLATQAVSLFENRDPSQAREFKDAALMDLVNRNLLPGLAWAEGQTLDRNGDQIIQMGEANELMQTGDIFQQLAAEFMSKADRDVSLDELHSVAAEVAASQQSDAPAQKYLAESQFLASQFENLDGNKDGTVEYGELVDASMTPDENVLKAVDLAVQHHLTELNGGSNTPFTKQDVLADGQPTNLQNSDYMQFTGSLNGQVPAAQSDDLAHRYEEFMKTPADPQSEDPGQRHTAEAQYLASQFQNLDADGNGTVEYGELITASQSTDENVLKAAEIASNHHMTELNGGSYTSFTLQDVIDDGQPREYDYDEDVPSDSEESPDLDVLQSPNSSVTDRLKAIKDLVADGQTTATIKDSNGNELAVRMEVVPVPGSSRTMVHMFATDPETGKEFVVLRAISDGDSFTRQRDANGQEVDFVGTRWQRNHPDSIFSVSSSDTSSDTSYDVG